MWHLSLSKMFSKKTCFSKGSPRRSGRSFGGQLGGFWTQFALNLGKVLAILVGNLAISQSGIARSLNIFSIWNSLIWNLESGNLESRNLEFRNVASLPLSIRNLPIGQFRF